MLTHQLDEVRSAVESISEKARRSNQEDQLTSLSEALYAEIRSLQVAVDEVDQKTIEVLATKQGPAGPRGEQRQ